MRLALTYPLFVWKTYFFGSFSDLVVLSPTCFLNWGFALPSPEGASFCHNSPRGSSPPPSLVPLETFSPEKKFPNTKSGFL